MVFFNYATMQMAAKIVYYGPGLCGKTTNLHVIYGRTAPTSRGEMVCLETETDRTLFFDLLPLDVGVIGGFKTRLQLYTVPGQVFYNTTRKLVLKGVDGIVFVADSQRPMKDPNVESLRNLRENLAEIGISLDATPRVLQYNKRDLPNILTIDELNDALNFDRSVEWYESSARNGTGVFETLKAISKLTLRSLKSRMAIEQRRPTVVASAPTPPPQPLLSPHAGASGIGAAIDAMAIGSAAIGSAAIGSAAIGSAVATTTAPRRDGSGSTISRLRRFQETARQESQEAEARLAPAITSAELSAVTSTELPAVTAPFDAAFPQGDDAGGEVSFAEIEPPTHASPEDSSASVKHVRVRSNVDILSELEKLRKVATQRPAPSGASKSRSAADVSLDDLLGSTRNHRKDVAQSFDLEVPHETLAKTRHVTIGLSFGDEAGATLGAEKRFDVDFAALKDINKFLLSLKFHVKAE
jgi:signal recognition particle receptor subunit beta